MDKDKRRKAIRLDRNGLKDMIYYLVIPRLPFPVKDNYGPSGSVAEKGAPRIKREKMSFLRETLIKLG